MALRMSSTYALRPMQLRPGQASLLSLAAPGLGHAMLGRPIHGLVVAAITLGSFAIGFSLLGDRIWRFGLGDGSESIVWMLPEWLNVLPMLIVTAFKDVSTPEALREIRMPRDAESLGLFLTSFSGMAAVIQAADAGWLARGLKSPVTGSACKVSPAGAAFWTYLVPGLGHIRAGQKQKGLLVGGAVIGLFVLGMLLSGGHGMDRAQRPIWAWGQSPNGFGVLISSLVFSPMTMSEWQGRWMDLGVVTCTVAGLMNVILMLDAYTVAERDAFRAAGLAVPAKKNEAAGDAKSEPAAATEGGDA